MNFFQESIVDVQGIVKKVANPVSSCTQQDVEIQIQQLFVVSSADNRLPLQLEDATRPDDVNSEFAVVKLDTRLDNRFLFCN